MASRSRSDEGAPSDERVPSDAKRGSTDPRTQDQGASPPRPAAEPLRGDADAPSTGSVRIGIVARPHGLRGAVVVTLDNPGSDSLYAARYLRLGAPAKEPVRYEIKQVGPGRRGQQIVSLAGVTTPEAVDALRGREVLLEEAQLPPLGEREYWFRDLLGLRAESVDGAALGEVAEVVDTAEVPVLVLRGEAERFVPFADPFVIEVDVEQRRIVVAPPEELEA